MSYYQELLPVLHQLPDIFPEERERRVGNDDVRFLEQFDAFCATEVAMLFEQGDGILVVPQQVLHISQINGSISVQIFDFGYLDLVGNLLGFVRKVTKVEQEFVALYGRAVKAGANKLLQAQLVEVQGKILEKVTLVRVVAIAEHDFVAEVRPVVLQLPFNVTHLRVELILLCCLGSV